jgi:molybdopterin-binding protein
VFSAHKNTIESSIVIHQVCRAFTFRRPIIFIACKGNDDGMAPRGPQAKISAKGLGYVPEWSSNFDQPMEKSIMSMSIRNRLPGTIAKIVSDKVVSELVIRTAAGEVTSIITTGSVKRMNLKEGDKVFAIIKATEVSIEKE